MMPVNFRGALAYTECIDSIFCTPIQGRRDVAKTTAHAVVLEILRQADGEWTGKTKLFKAFYFAHLYYAAERPGALTHWPIARMPQGPGIDNSEGLFSELVRDGLLTV